MYMYSGIMVHVVGSSTCSCPLPIVGATSVCELWRANISVCDHMYLSVWLTVFVCGGGGLATCYHGGASPCELKYVDTH